MKKKSTKRSAFFNLRVLVGLSIFLAGVFLALIGLGAFSNVFAQSKSVPPSAAGQRSGPSSFSYDTTNDGVLGPADKDGRFRYLIEFAEPGILRRQAHPSGKPFRMDTPKAVANREQIKVEQAAHIQDMAQAIGRELHVTHYFLVTHSGLATRLTPEEAQIVRTLPGVKSVERERLYQLDTYRGPSFIGADQIWNGSAVPSGVGTRGAGIVIAQLDTGVDPSHPSFRNDVSCGHGQGGNPAKLITYLDCATTDPNGLCNGPSPEDTNGHGSHTSSTSGGNTLLTSAEPPPTFPPGFSFMSGVAPCANIRSYKVCPDQCPSADIQAGMNSVLLHGDPKVMNFSISGGTSPWSDNDRRKLDLVDAGVVVSASAGNTNTTITDPVGQVNHRGPWVMTVAASTRDGEFAGSLSAAGPGTPPSDTQNITMTRGSDSPNGTSLTNAPIKHFLGQTNEGCSSEPTQFPAGFFNNSVALVQRGGCTFTEKITNAFNAGAIFVAIRNNQAGTVSMATPLQPNVPAWSMDQAPGIALAAFVDANPSTATVNFSLISNADSLANFSFRGPIAGPLQNLTKPDITNPGVNIYAAVPGGYDIYSGTSMSSPHTAGSAALVRAVNPAWTAPEVKSALMMTAFENGHKEDLTTPWDADDVGNGRADLTKAARAGLVMHETFANFLAANPGTGGDPKTLNVPSVRNMNCTPSCTWTRTVRNTRTTPTSWTTSGVPISSGFTIDVQPASFNFNGNLNETQQITITATPTTTLSAVAFGKVMLTAGGGAAPAAHISVAIKSGTGGATPTPTPTPGCPSTITHSASQTIVPGNSVSCNDGSGHHSDNSYWRAFNMNTFVGGAQYDVTSVSFGIENATAGSGGSQPITVRLYTNSGGAFPGGTRTELASTTVNVTNQEASVLNVPLAATVPAGTSELVMEVFTPDGQSAGHIFFIGSNTAGQTGPSYISAADCGITTPTDFASINFPNIHLVMNVNGGCAGGATPTPTPGPSASPCLEEGFNDINTLVPGGWFRQNNSQPLGPTAWFQGSSAVFPSHSGAPNSYIAANYQNTGAVGTISNWLLTPVVEIQNGTTLTFYTRTVTGQEFPDRLQVRVSTSGASTNVGTLAEDVGDFTTLLLDINASKGLSYPEEWTQFVATVTNVPSPTTGRFAFRYYVHGGGSAADNSDYIGIDTVAVYCGGPPPTPTPGPTPTPTPGMPVVNVSASSAQVGPGQSTAIVVSRNFAGADPVTITYSLAGKARLGIDYTLAGAPGQVTIPAGQTSAQIVLQSLADRNRNKVVKAKITLHSGAGYNLGSSMQIKIKMPKRKL